MKTISQSVRTFVILICLSLVTVTINGQVPVFKKPSPGDNRKAMVGERIGITDVTINYDRPGVKGREGKIYGTDVVYEGFTDISKEYGTSTNAPWRAGANENTTIEFSTAVKVEGKDLPAGKYGFFVAYGKEECTVIFSKDNAVWGNFFYNEKNDALRVKVKTVTLDKSVEWLKYEFINQTKNSATIALQWEKVMIPFKVEVDLIKTQLDEYTQALKTDKGFAWQSWIEGVNFCLKNNVNTEEALKWCDVALQFDKNFQILIAKAQVQEKLGKQAEADVLKKEAFPMASMDDLHNYGKQLIATKKSAEALEIFKMNAKQNPKKFTTSMGLTRGYSANGDYKSALVNAKVALTLAPDETNKKFVEGIIKKLEAGTDIN
ncbi:MAG: DUF2911 domain-containing protein [Bacteroidota bacterium]|nr:DUF2911 domain-containing protein [Bacteroidota bacterium]